MRNIDKFSEQKQELIDSTIDLVFSEGYQNLSMRILANKISYSTGSIYYHFKDKKDLMDQLFLCCCKKSFGAVFEDILANCKATEAALQQLLKYMVEEYSQNKYLKVYFDILPYVDISKDTNYWNQSIKGYIEDCVSSGLLPKLNSDAVSSAFNTTIDGFVNCVVRDSKKTLAEKEKLCDELAAFIVAGIKAFYE